MTREDYATVSDIVQFLNEYQNVSENEVHSAEFELNEFCTLTFDCYGEEPYIVFSLSINSEEVSDIKEVPDCPNDINGDIDIAEGKIAKAFDKSDFKTNIRWDYEEDSSDFSYQSSAANPYYTDMW